MAKEENDPHDIDGRITRLLDQLEARNLSAGEAEKIQKKISFLQSMKQ